MAILGNACQDAVAPDDETLSEAELLTLRQQPTAPTVTASSFHVVNSRRISRTIVHTDQFNTLFVRLEFPAGSMVAVDGAAVGDGDSILVTVTPDPATYRLTLTPPRIEFRSTLAPEMTFSYAVYGDRSVADGSPTYPSREAYSAALDVWLELTDGRWRRAAASETPGFDTVFSAIERSGTFQVAAPR